MFAEHELAAGPALPKSLDGEFNRRPFSFVERARTLVPVAAGSQLPESLKRLVEAWQMEGASRDEIVGRLDQLDLLAHEERIRLMIELLPPT